MKGSLSVESERRENQMERSSIERHDANLMSYGVIWQDSALFETSRGAENAADGI
jgi:hypothetical protein